MDPKLSVTGYTVCVGLIAENRLQKLLDIDRLGQISVHAALHSLIYILTKRVGG